MASPDLVGERPVAVVTGTSRDVGEQVVYGLTLAGWNVLGTHRNPQHDEDQERLASRVEAMGGMMRWIRADHLDPETPSQVVNVLQTEFQGQAHAFVMNAAAGIRGTLEDSIAFNYDANLRMLRALAPLMPAGSPVVYEQSIQAETEHPEAVLHVPAGYGNVRGGKRVASMAFRQAIAPGGEFEMLRYGEVVGNGLDRTFVTRLLKRRPEESHMAFWVSITEHGFLPTAQDYANSVVREVTQPYPSGHTEYVGVRRRYRSRLSASELELFGPPPMRTDSILTLDQIYAAIPHRWPIMLLGGVSELVPGERAVGYLVDLRHPDINWRAGHFPGREIVPGVMSLEAANQLGALTVNSMEEYKGRLTLLTGYEEVKYRQSVEPGEEVRIEVDGVALRDTRKGAFGKGHLITFAPNGKISAEATASFFLVDPKAA